MRSESTLGSVRAKLKPVKRVKKGVTYWAARGFVPIRQADGTIARGRREHGIGGDTAAQRQKEVDEWNARYEQLALNTTKPLTFARAYHNYIEAGYPVPIFGEVLVKRIGVRQACDIDDSIMVDLTKDLFKPDAKPAYINRHLYTPVLAILRQGLKEKAPQLTRPKGYKDKDETIAIPSNDWFRTIFPHLGHDTQALLAFLTCHGRRLGDALGRVPSDVNIAERTLIVGRTKNGDPVLVDLHPRVVDLIDAMPGWQKRKWLFTDGPTSGSNVRKDILIGCLKAAGLDPEIVNQKGGQEKAKVLLASTDVDYFTPHEIGRHAFATRMLRAGYSLQYVKDAGGWKSIEVLSKLYGHLERKDWVVGVHKVGTALIEVIDEAFSPPALPPPSRSCSDPVSAPFDTEEQ